MITNDMIFALAHEQHISITLVPLPQKIQGLYSYCKTNPQIAINQNLSEESPEYRSILAEELGHHFTSSGETHPQTGMAYYNRIQHDRIESRATKWAADFLIPTELLLRRIEDCSVSCIHELADTFQVTIELMQHKLYFMSCKAFYWPLSGDRSLCLVSLPSIYIYDPITGDVP